MYLVKRFNIHTGIIYYKCLIVYLPRTEINADLDILCQGNSTIRYLLANHFYK
jgi:hypothetical protein